MHSQTQLGGSEIFEISEIPRSIILRIKITDSANRILSDHLKQLNFQDVEQKGKYSSLQFSFSRQHHTITVVINKYYYLNVLNMKKYEVLLFSRAYQTNFQEFLSLFIQIYFKFIKFSDCRLIHYDTFSLTITKEFRYLNWKHEEEARKLFLKMSPFYFRRNPYVRSKQCEQYFAVILKPVEGFEQPPMPTQQQFFKSPRVSFLDDVYSNDSFAKRFCPRFLLFYQAHSLFVGEAPFQHRYVKQFYMKCASKCSMNTLRLKKISFSFKIPAIETNRNLKLILYLYCVEEDKDQTSGVKTQQPFTKSFKQKITNFTLEMMIEQQSNQKQQQQQQTNSQNLQQIFLKHLAESIYIGQDFPFVETMGTGATKVFRIYNEVGFAWILGLLCFFIDRITFKNVSSKLFSEPPYPNNYKDSAMGFRLPASQEYKLKKYAYNYCVEIKSTFNHGATKQEEKPKSAYESSITKITMVRKKVAKDIFENFQFLPSNDQIKGLIYYLGELLRKWNATDCYNDINSFVANYMNIIVDKNKEKNEKSFFKNAGMWKQVIDGLSALVQAVTKSFCSAETTVVFYILRTYEDSRRNQELTKSEINEGEEVMLMTFKYLKITTAGWVEVIPSCVYYFEMLRDQTYLYMEGEKKPDEIGIKFKREQIEKTVRSYLARTLKNKIYLPPVFYRG